MSFLEQVFVERRVALEETRSRTPYSEILRRAKDAPPTRAFAAALNRADRIAVIAEIKFKSPSAGVLHRGSSIEEIAQQYESACADALSVLTEPNHFGGSLEFLQQARAACSIPLLRKDFLFDPYQIAEARVHGADAVLLIAAMLERGLMLDLVGLAQEFQLAALLELHDEADLSKCDGLSNVIWGVNHRNLKTLAIDLATSLRLLPLLPRDSLKVAESGIETSDQLQEMWQRGANAVLIGSSLMRAESPGDALRNILSTASFVR